MKKLKSLKVEQLRSEGVKKTEVGSRLQLICKGGFFPQNELPPYRGENLKASRGSGIFQRWREERGSERTRERWGEGKEVRSQRSEQKPGN